MYPQKPTSRLDRIRSTTTKIFTEYCSISTIHGIGYIGGSDRSYWVRFWWLLMLLVSLFACGSLIDTFYWNWQENPVIISFDERQMPVSQIPFPAVTICPESQYQPQKVNFTKKLRRGKISQDEAELMFIALLSSDCPEADMIVDALDDLNFTFQRDIVEVWKTIRLHDWEIIDTCSLKDDCRFTVVLTDMGICYSFNILPHSEIFRSRQSYKSIPDGNHSTTTWTIDEGYHNGAKQAAYPHTTLGPGDRAGMQLELRIPLKWTSNLCGPTEGYFLFLHSPAEYPLMPKNYVYLKYVQQIGIIVRPEIIKSSKDLSNYSPEQRQCFYSNERPLRYFINYTYANCEMECYINYTRKNCKCVRYFMPRDDDIAVCEILDPFMDCFEYDEYLYDNDEDCHCLPGCNSIEYSTEIVPKNQIQMDIYNINSKKYKYSLADIYFSKFHYMGMKRSAVFGWMDFIAGCGGLLGLCMGVSLLSLVELFYYCFVRPMMAVVTNLLRSNTVSVAEYVD